MQNMNESLICINLWINNTLHISRSFIEIKIIVQCLDVRMKEASTMSIMKDNKWKELYPTYTSMWSFTGFKHNKK